MALTKKEYEQAGARAAIADRSPGVTRPPAPKDGTWQHRAWLAGYEAEAARTTEVAKTKAHLHMISEEAIVSVSQNWMQARREHVRQLVRDHNAEMKPSRRGRLYRAVGRMFELHGIKSAIPTINNASA